MFYKIAAVSVVAAISRAQLPLLLRLIAEAHATIFDGLSFCFLFFFVCVSCISE